MNITEDKLKAAIQIALGMRGIYTEETESALIHHVKALSIDSVSKIVACGNCNSEPSDMYCEKCYHNAWDRVDD